MSASARGNALPLPLQISAAHVPAGRFQLGPVAAGPARRGRRHRRWRVAALLTYRGVSTADRLRDRVVLVGLRLAALAVLLFCLFRPTLILKAAVPQQNFLGVLVDDSRSMSIADRDGQPRSAFVQQQLSGPNARCSTRCRSASSCASSASRRRPDRVQSAAELKYGGTATRLGPALDRARDELAGLPLAGLVMVTDGADTSDAAIDESLASLKARSIPVFTVGVGQERFARDIQVTRVETPRAVLKGTALVVDVVLSQTGYGGQTVPLSVEDDGRIVSTQEVTLPADGESATVKVRFTAVGSRARACSGSRCRAQAGEQVTQNNARDALIEVNDRAEKVLYFEGEPRFEMQVHPPRRRGRQEPAGRHPAAHRREQVPAARRQQRRRADRRLPEDARGAVRVPRRSSSAASKRRRSRPSSCACSPTSSASAAAAC